ncbi:MAG TPA: DUF1501 domain-containing protein [Thermoanaerobaculia bacterium]|nr:DUF1501 domain-containing protein [Thermoanaerobaculia bacterium]
MNRRTFLKSSGLALVAGSLLPNVFVRMAQAGTARGKRVLVAIFQRGAVDGLNVVVPHGEQAYYAARPTLAIAREQLLDLDGFFGMHPSLAPLLPHFENKDLGFVHAAGSPDATRSHFDAQDFMESGTPGIKSTQDGFLARALGPDRSRPLAAVALSQSMPRILTGAPGAVAMSDVARFGVRGDSAPVFEALYGDAFQAAKILKSADPAKLQPANGAQYPRGPLGDSLRQIAQLIRSDVGLEIAFTDVGGWDTHAGEANALTNNLKAFAEAIAAFAQDLGSRMSDVVLVTMSEFGRTVRENGNRGTDHGHANVMMLMGAGVKGGRVHGRWPGLTNLYEGRDLVVTTDFRDVFAEVLTKHLGVASLAPVFPGYAVKTAGIM